MIKVLVVEDSAVVRDLLVHILNSDPEVQVVATASNGGEALQAVEQNKPDLITMDIHMPGMDGFDATRRIMERRPTPIVIVSGTPDIRGKVMVFRAMEAGALAVLPVAEGIGHPAHAETAAELIRTVKLMSEVKVVRRWARPRLEPSTPAASLGPVSLSTRPEIAVVAIGASTGGPQALQCIVSGLPRDFPAPILVVQHIATGFIDGFANWLGQYSRLPVRVGAHGEAILPGHIYVAPDGYHMKAGSYQRILLGAEEPENGLRPSVASLFRSVATFYGCNAAGVLLSGMGKDGAYELKLMKEQGAMTIAQNMESSVVHGMPGEAIKLGAATYVLPPEKIACMLGTLVAGMARRTTSDL